jgi:hypothetical protein
VCEWQRLLVYSCRRRICLDLGGDRGLARGGRREAGRATVRLVTGRRLTATNTRRHYLLIHGSRPAGQRRLTSLIHGPLRAAFNLYINSHGSFGLVPITTPGAGTSFRQAAPPATDSPAGGDHRSWLPKPQQASAAGELGRNDKKTPIPRNHLY